MATFNGTMSELPRGDDPLTWACKVHMAEAISKYSRPIQVVEYQIKVTQCYKDHEAHTLMQDGALSDLESDRGYGLKRLVMVWHAQGRVDEEPGVHPAYQIDLWLAEYKRMSQPYVPLGKRVGLEWVSPVSIR